MGWSISYYTFISSWPQQKYEQADASQFWWFKTSSVHIIKTFCDICWHDGLIPWKINSSTHSSKTLRKCIEKLEILWILNSNLHTGMFMSSSRFTPACGHEPREIL